MATNSFIFSNPDEMYSYYTKTFQVHGVKHVNTKEKYFIYRNIKKLYKLFHPIESSSHGIITDENRDDYVVNRFTTGAFAPLELEYDPKTLDSLNQDFEEWNNNNFGTYIYPHSKTLFRKTVHSNLPDSVYSPMFSSLKEEDLIDATGQYVTFINKKISQETFDKFFLSKDFDPKMLSDFIEHYEMIQKDNIFYQKKIGELCDLTEKVIAEVEALRTQLNNKNLTTWY